MPKVSRLAVSIICIIALVVLGFLLWRKHTTSSPTIVTSTPITHSLLLASNQWYTSIYKNFPTQPIFAMPLAFQISKDGLGFSYPQLTKTPNTIFAPYIEDFHVGFSSPLQKPTITGIGDWNVTASSTTQDGNAMSYTLAHGVPFTTVSITGKSAIISAQDAFTVSKDGTQHLVSGSKQHLTNMLLSIRGHNYLISFPQEQEISIDDKHITIQNPTKIYIALLDTKEHYDLFLKTANISITNTGASYNESGKNIDTSYTLSYTGKTKPLIALYPHQTAFLSSKFTILGTYQTIRGTLSLIQTAQFVTSIPQTIPLATFPKLANTPSDLKQAVKDDIEKLISDPFPTSKDYYLGVWYGKAATLLQLSDTVGLSDEHAKLLAYVTPKFVQSMKAFHYDKTLHSLIADTPEFGNEQLNDHHFHYGYFIRTAAVLATADPSIIPAIKENVNAMVGDIATTNRNDSVYPYLRNFDTYEGHSWASGDANFGDGNDQESSSEAINAWYGIYLWSNITKDTSLHSLALSLYSSEIESTKYYWFGENGLYTAPYNHALASIVWGGKVDFSTWFSPETNMIYGIQLLPFTPGSFYVGSLKDFTKYAADFSSHGGTLQKDWGDIYLMWKSFYSPKEALQEKTDIKTYEDGNSKSNLLYFLYYNQAK